MTPDRHVWACAIALQGKWIVHEEQEHGAVHAANFKASPLESIATAALEDITP